MPHDHEGPGTLQDYEAPKPSRELPPVSLPLLRFFRFIVRGYFRRHFTAVRLRGTDPMQGPSGGPPAPLIVYANHAGWWDPMTSVLLAGMVFPGRRHFAPMDADALARYPILRRIGIFPVDLQTARGAAQFLRTGESVLRAGGVLWITPQGRFADARERPLVFKPGIASLLTRVPGCTALPLAIEYPFWDERLPETLLEFGTPVNATSADRDQTQTELIVALGRTMDSLAAAVQRRSPAAFDRTLLHGRVGTGGFYAIAQRLKAFLLRRPYQAAHTRHSKPVTDPILSESPGSHRPGSVSSAHSSPFPADPVRREPASHARAPAHAPFVPETRTDSRASSLTRPAEAPAGQASERPAPARR